MPSRLPTPGMTLTEVAAARDFTAPDGTVYPKGYSIPMSKLAGIKHLNALFPKYLLPIYGQNIYASYSKPWLTELLGFNQTHEDFDFSNFGYQQHHVTGSEVLAAVAAGI